MYRNDDVYDDAFVIVFQLPHNVGEGGAFSVDTAADTANSCWNHVRCREYVS